jgi:MATE family multidrug resistance protein
MAINTRQLRMIAALSLPAVITNITTPILALTDVAIVGHMGSAIFIAAIAVGGTMFNTMFWLFGFLRMGSSGLTAQAYGAGDRRGAQTVLARSLLLALLIGIAMIAAREPVCSLLFDLLDVDGSTASVARSYFMIVVWSAPAVLGLYSLTGWFVGMQDSRTPMWVSLFVDVFNIGASLMFVFLIRMKIEGVATGTLVAQWAGFLLALFLAVRKYGWHKVGFRNLIDGLPRFFRINSDIFLRTVCLVAVTLWFTRTGAMQGPVMLAVNALLMQLFTLYSFFMDGLAFASEALCGRYLGAGDRPMLSLSVRSLMGVGIILALVFTAVYVGCGEWVMELLSSDRPVVELARHYSVWAMMVPLVGFGAFLWDGVFIGLTRTRMMLISMATAMLTFFALYYLLFPMLGNHGLWIAFLGYLLMRGVVLTIAGREYLRSV